MTSCSASHSSPRPDSSFCRFHSRGGWSAGWVILLAFGCTTGQIGGEVDGRPGENASAGQCEEVSSLSLGIDEPTNLNISAQDLIDAIEGTHEASMSWTATSPFEGVTVTPESGASSITVQVQVDEESAVLVALEPKKREDGQESNLALGEEAACEDELRVDATVTVTTENGALNDTFATTFSTTNGHLVRASIPLPEELEGSFLVDVSSLENGGHKERLDLAFVLGTMSGRLSGHVETNNGDVATAGGTTYAEFPTGGECEYGYTVDAESEWALNISAALTQHTAFQLAWDGGSSTPFTVAPTVGVVCYEDQPFGGEASLRAALSVDVSTGDDSIAGTWDLAARVDLQADGSMGEISVFRDNYLGATYAVEEFEQETGITGVDSSADALSFQFGYVIPSDPDVSTYGSIAILEATIADCVTDGADPETEESPEGGASAPGCSGTDFTELQTGTLSAVD